MARYIDADKLISDGWRLEKQASSGKILSVMSIADVPTADVVEVKHGKWKRIEKDNYYWFECSECSERTPHNRYNESYHSNYCPNCGAKMNNIEED